MLTQLILIPTLLLGATPPTTPERCAGAPTRFATAAASPSTVSQGGTTRLTARLIRTTDNFPVMNTPIGLWARRKGTAVWALVTTVKTDADGNAATSNKPPFGRDYQWRYGGSACLATTSSKTLGVGVRPIVTTKAAPAAIRLGRPVAVYGTVRLGDNGQPVYLQRFTGRKWIHVTATKLNKNRAFRFSVKPAPRGVHRYRVTRPADPDHLLSFGPQTVVRVT